MTAYERLVDALQEHGSRVRNNGTRATAQCPAHADRSPSLSISAIEGQALVYCHGGCPIEDVMAALGMTKADLYDERRGASYPYTDVTGTTILRTVHRTPDKRFRQSVNDKSVVPLYRLAEVVKAIEDEQKVYLVEGEKDVHALESIGVVATTAPMGATNWHKVDPTPLYGGDIVVVVDRDEAGDAWAQAVRESLSGMVMSLTFVHAKVGKDSADHAAAGLGLDELEPYQPVDRTPALRELKLTPASKIRVRPVHWLWLLRIALGTLALLGGREGVGKSTMAYWIAAVVTRGQLPGRHEGQPKSVIVAATEDSWEHTIVPRLMAAGADLDRVYRVDVTTALGVDTGLSLPRDLPALREQVDGVDAALILLDPLMSRLDSKLDSHKDAEVRIALEPLVKLAHDTDAAILGLIHVNKSHSTDPLTTLMASRAFAAVARSVLFVMADPDEDNMRLLGQPKNNLGRTDLPTLTFSIESAHVADTDEGPVWTGRVNWIGERDQSIQEALEAAGETADTRSATGEAALWLVDYLTSKGGTDDSATIKSEGARAGHSHSTLKRARTKIKARASSEGFPRRSFWSLPTTQRVAQLDQHSESSLGESEPNGLTDPTGHNGHAVGPVGPVGSVGAVPPRARESDDYSPPPPSHCPDCHHETAGPPGRSCSSPDLHPTGVLL